MVVVMSLIKGHFAADGDLTQLTLLPDRNSADLQQVSSGEKANVTVSTSLQQVQIGWDAFRRMTVVLDRISDKQMTIDDRLLISD